MNPQYRSYEGNLNTNGSDYAVLHSFVSGFVDGSTPYAGLIQGQDGGLYGTTSSGGPTLAGILFRISTDGSRYEILHNFEFGAGAWPQSGLIQGKDGLLYGVTSAGGSTGSSGVVYCLATNGLGYTVLRSLPANANPSSTLFQADDGALYGTTESDGDNHGGSLSSANKRHRPFGAPRFWMGSRRRWLSTVAWCDWTRWRALRHHGWRRTVGFRHRLSTDHCPRTDDLALGARIPSHRFGLSRTILSPRGLDEPRRLDPAGGPAPLQRHGGVR